MSFASSRYLSYVTILHEVGRGRAEKTCQANLFSKTGNYPCKVLVVSSLCGICFHTYMSTRKAAIFMA